MKTEDVMSGVQHAPQKKSVGYKIESMTEHDLLDVVEIERECRLSPWGWEAYYQELRGETVMLVARPAEPGRSLAAPALYGFAAARLVSGGQMHINNIGVRPAYQRMGLGGALLRETMTRAAGRGAVIVHLEVRPSNEAAIELYRRHFFSVVGRRPRYYSNPPEDALLMSHTPEIQA